MSELKNCLGAATRARPGRAATTVLHSLLALSLAATASWATATELATSSTTASAAESGAPAGPTPNTMPTTADEMAARLRAQYPSTKIDSVSASVVPGLYEVVMGKNVAYVEPTGRYFVFGHVWDMQQRRDKTADLRGALDKVDLSGLPQDLAIKAVRGTGKRVLHVFADPQCGYCRQLEKTIDGLTDTTVYTYVLPILGPDSRRLAEAIACAPRRAEAWHDWMTQGAQPPMPASACSAKVGEQIDAVQRAAAGLGIQATPTLMAGDGRKRAGALPAAELVAWLDRPPEAANASSKPSGVTAKTKSNPTSVAAAADQAFEQQQGTP